MKLRSILMVCGFILLTACSGSENKQTIVAVNPPEGTNCAVGGMILSNYPGPKGQIHYKDTDKIDFFCETKELFQVYAEPGMPARVARAFVQDSGETDWNRPEGHWINAITAYYVVGSSRTGSMGPTYASFSNKEKARAFAEKYGGDLKSFEEVLAKVH